MQVRFGLFVLFSMGMPFAHTKESNNPLSSVIKMLADLKSKVLVEGDQEASAFQEYKAWCDHVTAEELHSIKLDETRINNLKSRLEKYFAAIEDAGEKISEEAKAIAAAIHDSKAAKDIREKQHSDFLVAEKDLVEATDSLSRAVSIVEREIHKGGAALLQINKRSLEGVLQALQAITNAAAFSSGDQAKLMMLVQSRQSSEADDDDDGAEFTAPSGNAYSSQSGSILDVLQDLKDKAENQLAALRKAEMQARYVFKELRTALQAQKQADEKELGEQKHNKAKATEDEAEADKDLKRTEKVLDVESEAYRTTKAQCIQTANDHEAAVVSRNAELKVIAKAIEVLDTMTDGAATQTYTFLQEGLAMNQRLKTTADLAHFEVISLVKYMAKINHSAELVQLASQIAAVIRYGDGNGDDPFAKIKELIMGLITKLEQEIAKDASERTYCEAQLAETGQKENDLEDQLKRLITEIDQGSADSASLKEDVRLLQEELANIAKEQAEMDKVRKDEKVAFEKAKADLELGIEGVRKALSVLRDYYGSKDNSPSPALFAQFMKQPTPPDLTHRKSEGAASGIIGILEMIESDIATSLAKEQTQEMDAQNMYEKTTNENKAMIETKEQAVKFKTKEVKALDKKIAQLMSDKDASTTEQATMLEYSSKVKSKCLAKPATYEERKKRRDTIMTGLKEALEILKHEATLLQSKKRGLRGGHLNS